MSAGTSRRSRTLPLTWTISVTVSDTSRAGSKVGNGSNVTVVVCPRRDHSSSPMCGARGASITAMGSTISRGEPPSFCASVVRALFSSISFEMAVLKRMFAMSSSTPAMVLCRARRRSSLGSVSITRLSPESSSTMLRHTRCRNRCMPTTSRVFHGREASSGPMAIS